MNPCIAQDTGALLLSGSLEIYEVEGLRQVVSDYLAGSSTGVLDLAAVEACDTAGAQLLCAARQGSVRAGKSISFARVSPAVAECWERLGLPKEYLNL